MSIQIGEIVHFDDQNRVKKLSLAYDEAQPNKVGGNTYVKDGGVFFSISGYEDDERITLKLSTAEVAKLKTQLEKILDIDMNKYIKIRNS